MRKFKLAKGVLSVGTLNGVLSDPNKIMFEGHWATGEANSLVEDGHLVEVFDKVETEEEKAKRAELADRAFAVGLPGDASEADILAEEKSRYEADKKKKLEEDSESEDEGKKGKKK